MNEIIRKDVISILSSVIKIFNPKKELEQLLRVEIK